MKQVAFVASLVALTCAASHLHAQTSSVAPLVLSQVAWQDTDGEDDALLKRQQMIADRFLQIIERNPRPGTALDRVYGFYVENGRLNDLLDRYRQRTEEDRSDAAAWMIRGLLASKRGDDAAAIEAFGAAEKQDPQSFLASYHLGRNLLLTGQATASFHYSKSDTVGSPVTLTAIDRAADGDDLSAANGSFLVTVADPVADRVSLDGPPDIQPGECALYTVHAEDDSTASTRRCCETGPFEPNARRRHDASRSG